MRIARLSLLAVLAFALPCSVLYAAETAPRPSLIQAALKRAGDNKPELVKALEKVPANQGAGMRFLIENMPERDLKTLKAEFLLENVALAYKALRQAPWARKIPTHVFFDSVLPYANINERRDNWRKDFYTRFMPLIKDCKTPAEAGALLNKKIFPMLKVRYSKKRPKPDQSPYESVKAGTASCTGLSILLVDACRAVGVPARFVGTPRWTNNSGNHSWVEIWDNGWHYTGAAEPTNDGRLNVAWFSGRASKAKRDDPNHAIYAVSFRRTPISFPMSWAANAKYVRAVNVTDRYTAQKKALPAGHAELMIQVVAGPGGDRVPAQVAILDAETDKVLFKGVARDERFDANDHLTAILPINRKYKVRLRFRGAENESIVELKQKAQTFTLTLLGRSAGERRFLESDAGKKLTAQLKAYFDAKPMERKGMKFDAAFDKLLAKNGLAIRKAAWAAYRGGYECRELTKNVKELKATFRSHVSPYTVRAVGSMPRNGWPVFIAMHMGGKVTKEKNDSYWQAMQHHYLDQHSVEGYLYVALRAPNDAGNGFYSNYSVFLTDNLIRQLIAFGNADPNKIFLMGYLHGGYGAFYQGLRMPDRFAAIHASAAAPNGIHEIGKNLRNTSFTYMLGESDTSTGHVERGASFDEFIKKQRGDRSDAYPVRMELVKDRELVGLPDRNKIRKMYSAVRNPVPRNVVWRVTVLKSFNWLHVPEPQGGTIGAVCENNTIKVTSDRAQPVHLFLDERLIDYDKPVIVEANKRRLLSVKVTRSLRTLCETLAERGDPAYMFTTRVPLTIELAPPAKK